MNAPNKKLFSKWVRVITIGSLIGLFTLILRHRDDRDLQLEPNSSISKDSLIDAALVGEALHLDTPIDNPVLDYESLDIYAQFRLWISESAEDAVRDPILFSEGRRLAKLRASQMKVLMRDRPSLALKKALDWESWLALPERLRPYVESPFSNRGDFTVYPSCRHGTTKSYEVQLQGIFYNVYFNDNESFRTSQVNTALQGIKFGNAVVLREEGAAKVSKPTALAVADFLKTAIKPWPGPLGQVEGPALAVLNGKVYSFASEAGIDRINAAIMTMQGVINPDAVAQLFATGADGVSFGFDLSARAQNAASVWTESEKKVLAIRLDFSDDVGEPITISELNALLVECSDLIYEMSYEKSYLTSTVTTEVLRLPQTAAYYVSNSASGELATDAKALASNAGYTLSNFDIYMYSFGGQSFSYAGLAAVGGSNNWINGAFNTKVMVHEFGHNLGLYHANLWRSVDGTTLGSSGYLDTDNVPVEHVEYGDPFDVMGRGQFPEGEFGMFGRTRLNWIPSEKVIRPTESGTYRIYRFDDKNALSNEALAMELQWSGSETFWIGYRGLYTSNTSLSNGAYVLWANTSNVARLIDLTPGSRANEQNIDNDRQDAALAVGEPFSDPTGAFTVEVTGKGGSGISAYIDVAVTLNAGTDPVLYYTNSDESEAGLVGSYVDQNLRSVDQLDWRVGQTISSQRVDTSVSFPDSGWGSRAGVGLTGGSDDNWDYFSAQWDGYIRVVEAVAMATRSDDSSRMWIDMDKNGTFDADELFDNNWGNAQGSTIGDYTPLLQPDLYAIRIQYEEGGGGNSFELMTQVAQTPWYTLSIDSNESVAGLTGSYINENLRSVSDQYDWRSPQSTSADGFRYDDFSSITGAQLNGNAQQSGPDLILTPAENWKKGSVWFDQAIDISDGFIASFTFEIADLDAALNGADGFAMVLQNGSTGSTTLNGSAGGSLGFYGATGLESTLALEFRTWGASTVSVVTGGDKDNPLASFSSGSFFETARVMTMVVQYMPASQQLSLTLPGFGSGTMVFENIDLATILGGDTALFGFSAGTGGANEVHALKQFQVSSLVTGTRVDNPLFFFSNSWGTRADVGLTSGTDDRWSDFSVQWDGYIRLHQRCRPATRSNDSSRLWIDINQDGNFDTTGVEFINNNWGNGQPESYGTIPKSIAPGLYPVRIQYEGSASGSNRFGLVTFPGPELIPVMALEGLLDFGLVFVDSPAQKNMIIRNDGGAILKIEDIEKPAGYSVDWSEGNIAAEDQKNVTVTFDPKTTGSYDGIITVRPDDEVEPESLAVTGLAQATGINAVNYENFASTSGAQLNGDARQSGSDIILTPAENWKKGSVWFDQAVDISDGFIASFTFEIADLDAALNGADGFAMVLQNGSTGSTTLNGSASSSLGFYGAAGLESTLALEFRTWGSSTVSVVTGGDKDNPLASFSSGSFFETARVMTMVVRYDSDLQQLSLTLPGFADAAMLFENIDLASILGGDTAIFGFSAGTGGANEVHALKEFKVSSLAIPENRATGPMTTTLGTNVMVLNVSTEINVPYALEYSESLAEPNWHIIDNFTGDGADWIISESFIERLAERTEGFYRMIKH